MSHAIPGPDFICVGMPKAGTGWLFDQLKYHPDFWMPPVKEFAYLLRPVPQLQSARNQFEDLEQRRKRQKWAKWSNRQKDDPRDFEFLREVNAAVGVPLDLERYVSFFRYKQNALSGDISSGYCALTPRRIEQIASRLPQTRIMLLVRDPIDRAWSHICMWRRAGKFDDGLLGKPNAFREFLEESGSFMRTSFPTRIATAWKESAPNMPFRHFLFDDIRDDPTNTRGRILQYLGADSERESGKLATGHNKKAKHEKLDLTGDARAVLVEMFEDELRACAEVLGGRAQSWPARYLQ